MRRLSAVSIHVAVTLASRMVPCAPLLSLLLTVLGCSPPRAVAGPSSPVSSWVSLSSQGTLIYTTDAKGNRVPDFSAVGYLGCNAQPPPVPVRLTLSPSPALKSSGRSFYADDTARIQDAIDHIAQLPLDALGFRGALLLRRGTYRISGTLRITASGIVLRGQGDSDSGTRLLATGRSRRTLIEIAGTGSPRIIPFTSTTILDRYIPVGSSTISVSPLAAQLFSVGDHVIITRPSTRAWIHRIGMDRIAQVPGQQKVRQWGPGTAELRFRRVISAIEDSAITLDAPIMCALEKRFGSATIARFHFPGQISNVGIENLSGSSEHRSPTDESHAWTFIRLNACRDAWVSNITARHFAFSAVFVDQYASRVTVADSACLDPVSLITGSRRYSFYVRGQQTLVSNCRARGGRHDFVTSGRTAGPNVFLRCTAENAHSDSGPHARWCVGILYDNVSIAGNNLTLLNRGGFGSGHGWTGASHVFWNCKADRMLVHQAPFSSNWVFGARAKEKSGNAFWVSSGSQVKPRSLFDQQLLDRRLAP